jgi:hypothetical protein
MSSKKLSGTEEGKQKTQQLREWIESLTTYNDNGDPNYDLFREYVYGKKLNRQEIKRELSFGDSTLKTNQPAKDVLKDIEDKLREAGILPPEDEQPKGKVKPEDLALRDRDKTQSNRDKQRLNQLEQQNAGLRAEVFDLKAKLKELNALDEFLVETGRIPR